jgi:hypothetical protein
MLGLADSCIGWGGQQNYLNAQPLESATNNGRDSRAKGQSDRLRPACVRSFSDKAFRTARRNLNNSA